MEEILKNPISWAIGGVASVIGVFAAMLSDPSMSIFVIFQVFVDNASALFTAASIAGFTLAPEVSERLARSIQVVAFVSGAVIVLKLLDQVWEGLKERIRE